VSPTLPEGPVPATAGDAGAISAPPLPPRPASGHSRQITVLLLLLLLALLVYSWINVGGSLTLLFHGLFGRSGLFRSVLPQSVPPKVGVLGAALKASVTTICIAVLSIAFGVVFAIALLPLAARNLTPSRPLYELVRLIMGILRAIPELIMLLLFNVVLGFSPFSAVVALTLHGTGVMGKLFAEAVEEMEMAPVDALRVAGASRIQVFLHAVLPGVGNTLLGLTLYRVDANFRSAVTLGAVGGGGIGFLIYNDLSVFSFKAVTTYIIILVIIVMGVERLSTILRARFT
jgi:phosphonate transport system permease protein